LATLPRDGTLRRQMDQIFDEMVNVNREAQMTWKPAVEIKDTEDNPGRKFRWKAKT